MDENKGCMGFILIMALVIFVAVLIAFYGNKPNKDLITPQGGTQQTVIPAKGNIKQTVTTVPYDDIGTWISQHSNVRIVSIASVNDGNYGRTTAFIVVYETGNIGD